MTITVAAVNDPPVLSLSTPPTLTEGAATAGQIISIASATDADGDAVTFSLTPGSAAAVSGFFAIDPVTGVVTLTAAGAAHVNAGSDLPDVAVSVSDGTARDSEAVPVPATIDVNPPVTSPRNNGQVPDTLLNAHITPGFGIDPLIPDTRQPVSLAPFLGQRFVVAAVQDARSLNSVNGLPGTPAPGVLDEVRRLTEQRPYAERIREHLDQGMGWWDVEGLRHSLEVANLGNAPGQPELLVHSYVSGRTLTMALEYLSHGKGSVPASYRASLANGKPLPGWLAFDPTTGVMIGTPPAGTEKITLKVQAVLQDGRTVTGSVTVEADTGRLILHDAVQPHAQAEPVGVPLFSAQLATESDHFMAQVEKLRAALTPSS